MKINKFILLAATLILGGNFIATNAYAIDLMDVYNQAVATDPEFKAAKAKFLADKQNLPMSKAALFPQLSAKGNFMRGYSKTDLDENSLGNPSSQNGSYGNKMGYSLTLAQSIFSFANWAHVWGAQAAVKQAEATFLAAEENLLVRTATAYFDVLLAKDVLSCTRSNKRAVERLLNQAKHKYEVGLTAITDLEDARAKYDLAVSEEIKDTNELSNKFEKLSEITGVRYLDLDTVKANFPLLSPQPTDIEQWVKAAEQQNFNLMAARYASIAARENIKVKNAGHLPTLNASGSYGYDYAGAPSGYNHDFTRTKSASAGIDLSVPLFQGGGVVAAAKQANYQYQEQLAQQDKIRRTVISNTRQTYLGILSNISKIKADQQAIKSAQNALRATEARHSVGILTMSDVLESQANLYKVQKDFANDEYNYIVQLLNLKGLTGILEATDLSQINSWLEKRTLAATNKAAEVKIKQKSSSSPHPKKDKINNPQLKKVVKSQPVKSPGVVEAPAKGNSAPEVVILHAEEIKQAVTARV